MISIDEDKVIQKASDSNNEIDIIDVINITNLGSIKISFQSRSKIAKFINLVQQKELKINVLTLELG